MLHEAIIEHLLKPPYKSYNFLMRGIVEYFFRAESFIFAKNCTVGSGYINMISLYLHGTRTFMTL